MNSVSRSCTVCLSHDSINDIVSAYQIALEQFGTAELSEFLPPRGHADYAEILGALVRLELAHSWSVGKPTSLAVYQARYPELFTNHEFASQLAQEEEQYRQDASAPPTRASDVADADDGALTVDPPLKDPLPGAAGIELGRTRPALGGAGKIANTDESEPEVELRLSEAMLEIPKVGATFLGFTLQAQLGKGAFGCVFLAQQGALAGRLVALKVATGLFNESQTLAQLQHTHIVPIYSFHHAQPFQAVCMPYLGSTTLADVLHDIREHKSLPNSGKDILSTLNDRKRKSTRHLEDSSRHESTHTAHPSALKDAADAPAVSDHAEARPTPSSLLELEGLSYVDSILWLAVRLADGLAHAHERGILHRDLKPANILLTDEGVPMLLDFNLAHDTKMRDSAAAASIGGTLPYMSPEHLEAFRGIGAAVDARSDVYSLGVILFELLTGTAPFPAYRKRPIREVIERMIQDRRGKALEPRRINPTIPPAVQAILHRCLAADPARRYQSARELHEDLQLQLAHRPLKHAANPSLLERIQKFRKRNPRLTSAGSVAGLALILLAGLASLLVVREEQRARLEARETLTRFEGDAQTTYFLLNARSAPRQLDEGQDAARTTLRHFQVLDHPNWHEGPAVQRLSAAQQDHLRAEVGQILVLLANAQQLAGERERDPASRDARFQDGLQFCSLATHCFPSDQTPQALWKQQAELYKRLKDHANARKSFERASEADLRTVQDRYLTARQLAEEGKFREALPLLREALRLSPQDFNLHFLQGICHDYLAQHDKAIECYRTCIALRPGFHGAYYNRGLSYLRQSQFESAKEDFDQVLKLKEDFAEAHLHRGLAWHGMKKFKEAEADFTAALENGHDETRLYFLRSKAREKAGDAEGAKKDRAEGIKRKPADEVSWVTRGLAFIPEDPKQALSDFEKALDLNPRSRAALQNKAHVLGKYFKRTEDAVKTLDRALELYPDDSALRAGRGVYLARLEKRAEALKDAELALQIDTNPPNLYQVAGIYALTSRKEADDRQEAFRLLSQALKKGFGFEYLEIDRDLDPIRNTPEFRRIVDAARAVQALSQKRR